DAVASGGLLAGDALFDDAHDVALLHDQEFFAVDLDLGARPFAEQHPVPDLDVDGDQLAGLVAAAGANRDDLALGGLFLGGIGNDDAAGGFLFGIDALDDNAVVKRTKLHDVLLKLLTEFKICVGGPQQRASLCRSFQARHKGHFLGPQEAPKKDLALADWECQAKSGTRLIRVPPSTLRPRAGEDPLARLSALLSQCCYRLDFGNFIQFLSLFVWEVISRLDVESEDVMASRQLAAKELASKDLRRQLEGYGLTTAQILYRLPDHPSLLQTYVWQDYDLCPRFPVLNRFLAFWLETLEGPLHSVTVAHARLIRPAEIRSING